MGKGKKTPTLKALNKMRRQSLKQFSQVRWLDAPMIVNADGEVEEANETENGADAGAATGNTDSNDQNATTGTTTASSTANQGSEESGDSAMVPRADIAKRAEELKRGIDKLQNDLMPRYREQQITPRDGAFVKALRKAGTLFLTKLTQTDDKTKSDFASNKEFLDRAMPQWQELERRIGSRKANEKNRDSLKATLENAVKNMNEMRNEIKDLLKRVNLKTIA